MRFQELKFAILAFQKELDPFGDNYEKSLQIFQIVKYLIESDFQHLQDDFKKMEKEFSLYKQGIDKVCQNPNLRDEELKKIQLHAAFTQDYLHNLLVELTGEGNKINAPENMPDNLYDF